MMDWQMILLQLRKHYKPLRRIAFEIGAEPSALQKVARYGVKTDLSYELGTKLVTLHNRHVVAKSGERKSLKSTPTNP